MIIIVIIMVTVYAIFPMAEVVDVISVGVMLPMKAYLPYVHLVLV